MDHDMHGEKEVDLKDHLDSIMNSLSPEHQKIARSGLMAIADFYMQNMMDAASTTVASISAVALAITATAF